MLVRPFEASRTKLRRARKHTAELETEIRNYLGRVPFYLQVAEGFTPTTLNWVVRVREDVPLDFAAMLGDAIHNLRSTLDLLACELVRTHSGDDTDVYFPFATSENEFEAAIKRRNMDKASPEAIDLLKSFKPYRGGNEALRAIHDLDIMDKHQMLIPAADMIGPPNIIPVVSFPTATRMGPIQDGMSLFACEGRDKLRIGGTVAGEFSLHFPLLFDRAKGIRIAPLNSGEVVPTLKSLANLVEGIVEAFAAL